MVRKPKPVPSACTHRTDWQAISTLIWTQENALVYYCEGPGSGKGLPPLLNWLRSNLGNSFGSRVLQQGNLEPQMSLLLLKVIVILSVIIQLGDNLEGYKRGRAGDNVGNYCTFLSALLELKVLFALMKFFFLS